jgi:isopenicillin N synthase-like dioxygenase
MQHEVAPVIPVLDCRDLASADPAAHERVANAVRVGLGHFGLIYLSHHGLDTAVQEECYDQFLSFCALPDAEKRPYSRPDIWFQRGWTPPNTEKAVAAGGEPDFKECWFAAPLPLDPVCVAQFPEIFAANVWPAERGAFATSYMALGQQVHAVGMGLLRGCELALGLPAGALTEKVPGAAHVTRALKYLPLSEEQVSAGVLWGEEHTDFNLLTLLPGGRFFAPDGSRCARPDDGSGLWLRKRPNAQHPLGELVSGSAPAGCIVAQVGQQLEILTGGALLATPHVIRAPKTPGYSRMSMAHFIHVHPHHVLYPLQEFRTEETVRLYSPPVLAGTYDIKTLVDIQLAPASALDKLGYRHYDRLAAAHVVERG